MTTIPTPADHATAITLPGIVSIGPAVSATTVQCQICHQTWSVSDTVWQTAEESAQSLVAVTEHAARCAASTAAAAATKAQSAAERRSRVSSDRLEREWER